MNIAIVDYGLGNPGSILNMLKHLGIDAAITGDRQVIHKAKKVIIPGVGSFDYGMEILHGTGLSDTLNEKALIEKVPVLGICLGMQLMTKSSEEGTQDGLGWIQAHTQRFPPSVGNLKVPHMGWNHLHHIREHPLTDRLDDDSKFYFVHSFHVICAEASDSLSRTTHGVPFDSMIGRDNIFGCQFHPEKSHRHGMRIFQNFNNL